MPSPAEEHRRRVTMQRASEIKPRHYKPPAKQPKGNRTFARKGPVRRV
jgi:hypothetical protein